MLASFAARMAARVQTEDQMAETELADRGEGGAGSALLSDHGAAPWEEAVQEKQQQSKHETPSAGEPQNPPLQASGLRGRE